MSRVVGWGKTAFRKYPLLTNTAIYASFYTAAELSQQTFNKYNTPEKPEIDYASAARIVSVGSCLYAPTLYYWGILVDIILSTKITQGIVQDIASNTITWVIRSGDPSGYRVRYKYKFLDRKFVGTAIKTVASKVVIDQFTMTPVLLASFYVILGYLEGKPNIFDELKEKYWKTFIANQCFWIPGQTINFYFIPPQLRVVYISAVSFVWINVLCFIKRQKMVTVEDKKDL